LCGLEAQPISVSEYPLAMGAISNVTGWDPIFEYDGKQTYAEMDKEAKVRVLLIRSRSYILMARRT
jgi:hypothetical protein